MRKVAQYFGFGAIIVIAALFSLAPTLGPKFEFEQGEYAGQVQRSAARVSANGRATQDWLIEIEDGRQFWVRAPTAAIGNRGQDVWIRVLCRDETAAKCKGILLNAGRG